MADLFSLEVIGQLKKVVSDPLKRKIISRDETIIGGLVLVLSNNDKKVVIAALEVLLSLATPLENRDYLKDFLGMQEQLHALAQDSNPLDFIRDLAKQLRDRINSTEPVMPAVQQLKQRDTNIQHNLQNTATKRPKQMVFLNSSKFKSVVLQITGLNDKHDMEVCREKLLTVRGVVSITFDLNKHRSILRVKPELSVQMLGEAIESTNTMTAEQVIKNENGEEEVISLMPQVKENSTQLPAYLPDDDSPIKIDDKAIRRFGVKEDTPAGAGWWNSATSFLAKSFYW